MKDVLVQFSFRISLVKVSTRVNQFHDFLFAVAVNFEATMNQNLVHQMHTFGERKTVDTRVFFHCFEQSFARHDCLEGHF